MKFLNRALGLGATRGRIYIKHPDTFKVSTCNCFLLNPFVSFWDSHILPYLIPSSMIEMQRALPKSYYIYFCVYCKFSTKFHTSSFGLE